MSSLPRPCHSLLAPMAGHVACIIIIISCIIIVISAPTFCHLHRPSCREGVHLGSTYNDMQIRNDWPCSCTTGPACADLIAAHRLQGCFCCQTMHLSVHMFM